MEFPGARPACLQSGEEIALGDLKLDIYPNQIEIISTSNAGRLFGDGHALMYHHCPSESFSRGEEGLYRRRHIGLAYGC